MKFAFISTILHYPWGGADTLWTRAAETVAAGSDRLFLAIAPSTAAHPRVQALLAGGAQLFPRPLPTVPGWPTRLLRKARLAPSPEAALNNALARFQPDLIVFSQGGTYDLLMHPQLVAWLAATGTPYRVVANWQQENPTLGAADLQAVRGALEGADAVYFVSTRNLAVTRRHLRSPLARASVIHNPLRWQPRDRAPWPAAGPARLATVSRLDEGKGVHLLLHALAELGASLPDWRLDIFGHGPAEASLGELIAHLGLGQRVRLAGHVADLRAIWSEHELMCSPALDDGVPMTIPEAMLCARPVLATCVGGAEDWLRDGETGFLCPAPTVPLLRDTLLRAFAARGRWPAMGEAAAASAQAFYRPKDFHRLLLPW